MAGRMRAVRIGTASGREARRPRKRRGSCSAAPCAGHRPKRLAARRQPLVGAAIGAPYTPRADPPACLAREPAMAGSTMAPAARAGKAADIGPPRRSAQAIRSSVNPLCSIASSGPCRSARQRPCPCLRPARLFRGTSVGSRSVRQPARGRKRCPRRGAPLRAIRHSGAFGPRPHPLPCGCRRMRTGAESGTMPYHPPQGDFP